VTLMARYTTLMPTLLIADDHPMFRLGVSYGLKAQGFEVVAEASDGAEAVARARETKPNAALLDAKMPVLDGIAACAQLLLVSPATRVVLFTTFSEPALIQSARKAGAVGFISKETEPARLAILLKRLINDPHLRIFPTIDLPMLSVRELEVLAHLSAGLTNKAIAKKLGLSPETIKDHVFNLYRKLEVNDRVGAVQRARDLGLI
jgi:two-component system, NarL family, nitrate/nitrite response regulator NarL